MINVHWAPGVCSSGSEMLKVIENDRLLGEAVRSVGSIVAVSNHPLSYNISVDASGKFSIDANGTLSLHSSISKTNLCHPAT